MKKNLRHSLLKEKHLLNPDDFRPTTPDVGIDSGEEEVTKYYVNNIPVSVVNERVQYYGKDGKLITESLKDYSRKNLEKSFHLWMILFKNGMHQKRKKNS